MASSKAGSCHILFLSNSAATRSFPVYSSAAMMPMDANLRMCRSAVASASSFHGIHLRKLLASPLLLHKARRAKKHGKSAIVQLALSHGLAVSACVSKRITTASLRGVNASATVHLQRWPLLASCQAGLRPAGWISEVSRFLGTSDGEIP